MSKRVPMRLRRLVRERARGKCEYCWLHEEDALFPHVPDHIIAKRHYGKTTEDNLAWSCYLCNHLKGSDIASVDLETGQIVPLFHPRKNRWKDHFRLEGGNIVPLTAIGRVTEHFLQLNHLRALESRQDLIRLGRYPR